MWKLAILCASIQWVFLSNFICCLRDSNPDKLNDEAQEQRNNCEVIDLKSLSDEDKLKIFLVRYVQSNEFQSRKLNNPKDTIFKSNSRSHNSPEKLRTFYRTEILINNISLHNSSDDTFPSINFSVLNNTSSRDNRIHSSHQSQTNTSRAYLDSLLKNVIQISPYISSEKTSSNSESMSTNRQVNIFSLSNNSSAYVNDDSIMISFKYLLHHSSSKRRQKYSANDSSQPDFKNKYIHQHNSFPFEKNNLYNSLHQNRYSHQQDELHKDLSVENKEKDLIRNKYANRSVQKSDKNDDQSKDREYEAMVKINLIYYPLVIKGLCYSRKQSIYTESIDYHLSVVNACVFNLIKNKFCQNDLNLNCYRTIQYSIKQIKNAKYLNCLHGQLESIDFIQQLFDSIIRRHNSNSERFVDEKYFDEINRLVVHLIDTKSNSSKFILPTNFAHKSSLDSAADLSDSIILPYNSGQNEPINTINLLINRCATTNECILKDFSCCQKSSIDFENRVDLKGVKEPSCRNSQSIDCQIRFILKLVLQSISILSIITGTILFFLLKLHTEIRIQVHLNFFFSSLITSIFSILLSSLVLENCHDRDGLLDENPIWCRGLLVVYRYGRLSNYFWMVCEALYLHQLVVNAFHKIKYLLKFCLIGWLIPFLLMVPYVIMHLEPDRNSGCWIDDEDHVFEWVYHLPPIICLVINSALLVNITRVLYYKLSSKHFHTAQKTILSITPIFGLQYLFSIIRPLERFDRTAVLIGYVGLVIDSSQGLIIVILFCFFNSKVYNFIKQSITKKPTNPEARIIQDP